MCFLVGCPSKGQNEAAGQQGKLVQTEVGAADKATKTGLAATDKGIDTLTGPLDWFRKLLTGDSTALMQAVAPAVQSLTGQYGQAEKAVKAFQPRGGERNKVLAELPFRKAGDIATLIGGAQEKGAAGLADIAGLLGQLGLGSTGAGTSAANAGLYGAGLMREQSMQEQEAKRKAGSGIGSFLGSLIGL